MPAHRSADTSTRPKQGSFLQFAKGGGAVRKPAGKHNIQNTKHRFNEWEICAASSGTQRFVMEALAPSCAVSLMRRPCCWVAACMFHAQHA